jgi:aspartate/methionine/tyrosine aminotransferase
VGVAYTENEEILLPMQKLNDLCQISSQTQLLVERMLSAHVAGGGSSNEKFVDVYLKSNRNNIRTRCDKLQQCLTDMDIPYLPADSGLFVWMDFREFLPQLEESITEETESLSSKEHRERQLYLKLMKEYGLLFTPGMSMRNERAGFFRCVFTAASEEEFELGLERIRTFVKEQREG